MATTNRFQNRTQAGKILAIELMQYAHRRDVIVLGIPRGGVVVGFEVARALDTSLDVCLVRNLGLPGHTELGIGAIALPHSEFAVGGLPVLNDDTIAWLRISGHTIGEVVQLEIQELQRRNLIYRGNRPQPQLRDRTIVLVDDGLATGLMMRAAIGVLKPHQPQRIVIAVPVAPLEICDRLRGEVDEVVCAMHPASLGSIDLWYEDFDLLSDTDVCDLLAKC